MIVMSGPLPSRNAFIAEYQSLSTAERQRFVVDLQEARGWETTLEKGVVVAKKNGSVRRIALDQRNQDIPIDIVVATDDQVESIADELNADVLGPETLRDELFYDLDRHEGMELFREHFNDSNLEIVRSKKNENEQSNRGAGEPTEASSNTHDQQTSIGQSSVGSDNGDTKVDDWTGKSSDDTVPIRNVLHLLLLVTAGVIFMLFLINSTGYGAVGVVDLFDSKEAVEASGSETNTAVSEDNKEMTEETASDTQKLPLGLSTNGDYDVNQIATSHMTAVKSQESLRFRVQSEGPTDTESIESVNNLDVQIGPNDGFLIQNLNNKDSADENTSVDAFSDGVHEYRRIETQSGVQYNQYSMLMSSTVTGLTGEYGARLIRTYLNTTETEITRTHLHTVNSTNDLSAIDDRTAYQITTENPPTALSDYATNYQASVTVMTDGFVRDLTVTYKHESTGEDVWIRFQYRRGEIDVDTPLWYDRGREGQRVLRPEAGLREPF
jgi:hypothetical protein